jgi:GNAT superfamily N-acetyltransferase
VTFTPSSTRIGTVDTAVELIVDEAEQLEQLVNGVDGTEAGDTAEGARASVRRLTDADLDRCGRLGLSRAWGAEQRKWGLLFEVGEVYGIEDEAGQLIATAVLTRYGRQFGSISMVLVAESHERRGYGTRIVRHVMQQASGATLVLHATPEGRPLYERLGFKSFATVEAHVGVFDPTGARAGRSRAASAEDLLQLARLDHEVYGVHRTALLKRLPRFAERVRVLCDEEGLITGYGALWRSEDLATIGPVLAPDVAGARDLITDLAEDVEGRIRLDVDAEADDLSAWACGHGLKPAYTCSHMVFGEGPVPMDPQRLHAPMMCALG